MTETTPATVAIVMSDREEAVQIERSLDGLGLKVYRVGTSEELDHLMHNVVPHVAILDHRLDDGQGFDICRRLRDDPRSRRVSVLIVLPSDGGTIEECFISGVNDFLNRPLDLDDVVKKVDRLCNVPDRRRVNTLALVTLDGEDHTYLGRAVNISESGILLELDASLLIGSVCSVRFNLPSQSEPVTSRCVVRRRARELTTPGGYGIEFVTMGPDDRGRLDRFFDEAASRRTS